MSLAPLERGGSQAQHKELFIWELDIQAATCM